MAVQAQESVIVAMDMPLHQHWYPVAVHMVYQDRETASAAADMVCQGQESVTAEDIAVADTAELFPLSVAGESTRAEATSGARGLDYILLGAVVQDHEPCQLAVRTA